MIQPEQDPVDLVRLRPLMASGTGSAEVVVAVIDGPVAAHPDLPALSGTAGPGPHEVPGSRETTAAAHATFVAGVLVARRGSSAPAICPGCTMLVDPVLDGAAPVPVSRMAAAVARCVDRGAWIINLSVSTAAPAARTERELTVALDYAMRRHRLVVAATGNQAALGGSALTAHPWVIPVAGFTRRGLPMAESNLGASVGRRGLGGPGEGVTSTAPGGGYVRGGGTSVAAAFVTGALALLWSAFPHAPGALVRAVAVGTSRSGRRPSVVPPLLNADAAYRALAVAARGAAMPEEKVRSGYA